MRKFFIFVLFILVTFSAGAGEWWFGGKFMLGDDSITGGSDFQEYLDLYDIENGSSTSLKGGLFFNFTVNDWFSFQSEVLIGHVIVRLDDTTSSYWEETSSIRLRFPIYGQFNLQLGESLIGYLMAGPTINYYFDKISWKDSDGNSDTEYRSDYPNASSWTFGFSGLVGVKFFLPGVTNTFGDIAFEYSRDITPGETSPDSYMKEWNMHVGIGVRIR